MTKFSVRFSPLLRNMQRCSKMPYIEYIQHRASLDILHIQIIHCYRASSYTLLQLFFLNKTKALSLGMGRPQRFICFLTLQTVFLLKQTQKKRKFLENRQDRHSHAFLLYNYIWFYQQEAKRNSKCHLKIMKFPQQRGIAQDIHLLHMSTF